MMTRHEMKEVERIFQSVGLHLQHSENIWKISQLNADDLTGHEGPLHLLQGRVWV